MARVRCVSRTMRDTLPAVRMAKGRDFSCWEGPPGASLGDVAQETYLEEGYITRVDDSGPWIAQPRRKAFGGILEGPIAWLGLSCVWTGRSGWTGRGAQFDIQLVRPSERGHEGGARVVAECRHVFEDAPLRLPRIIATLITPSSKRVAMSPAPFVPLSANVLRSTEAEQSIVSLAKAGDEFRVVRSVEVGGDLTVRCFRLVYGSSVRKDAAVHMKDGENFLALPPPSWDVFACLVDSEEESSFYTLLDLGEDVESHITPEY